MDDSSDDREMTFGERAVGLTFNPSQDSGVREMKEKSAAFIDYCNDMRNATEDGEVKRMFAVAITEMQTAQMWAVKALTWSN